MTTLGFVLLALPVICGSYAYVGYPFVLWLLSRGRKAPVFTPPEQWPEITIVVPAFNEESQIGGKIEAVLRQDYPVDRRHLLVLSDASTDGTDDVVRSFAQRGVELMRMPVRGGKTAAENASCARLHGTIIVNSDATVRMAPGTLRKLVTAMVDPTVGVASTRDVSVLNHDVQANETEAHYVGYEMHIRDLETTTGGIVGASGSGYAIRRDLHDIHIPEMLSRDFAAALTARSHGFRAVSVEDAVCWVPRTSSLQREYRRKVRTVARGMDTLRYQAHLLDPVRYGAFAWKLWSHKVLRWAMPVTVLLGAIGVALLAPSYLLARIALLGALCVAGVMATAWKWSEEREMPGWMSLVAFGGLANVAVLHAIVRIILGHDDHVWEPTRRIPQSAMT